MSSALRGLDEDTEVTDEARKQCSLWWEEIEGRLVSWEAKTVSGKWEYANCIKVVNQI